MSYCTNYKLTAVAAVLVAVATVLSGRLHVPRPPQRLAEEQASPAPIIESQPEFYEPANFSTALAHASAVLPRTDVAAVIVPHHLLASAYLARTLKAASGRAIETVVVVGPNHRNIGPSAVATTHGTWLTAEGNITTNEKLVARLAYDFDLHDDPGIFTNEHSIGAIVPFISHYFPAATLVPVVLSSHAGEGDARRLADWLNNHVGANALIIFSIDFSHYLTQEKATQRDQVTQQLLQESNLPAISRLNNDYVDSPASLMTALAYADKKHLTTDIQIHGNSNDLSQFKSASTTSYFAVLFTESPN